MRQGHVLLPKPEDAVLLRYEGHLSREFHRSLGNLVKLTKSGDDLVEIEIENAPNEPNLTTESIAGEGIVADLEIAETVKKGSGTNTVFMGTIVPDPILLPE